MDEYATALADAIVDVLPAWVERSVVGVLAGAGWPVGEGALGEARAAGRRAAEEVGAEVRALLCLDIDSQRSTPLGILRDAVRYPTEVLRAAGVPSVAERDEVRVRLFPDDDYDLSPATFADVDPRLAEPGLAWGAAKAFTHLRRHAPTSSAAEPSHDGPALDARQNVAVRIAAYVPDLIDRSKVAAAAPDATFVDKPSKLAALDAALVVVDLGRPGVVDELGSLSGRVIGFARHTERDLIARARAAGCDEVLVRSDFFPRLGELLADG